eukprot:CAMPEP_0114540142 /NCGR_PEP_ID=MMETSP0114-20121206/608_1 /TAXON_ID=31324 /ORGANISM="Goniomonas sp, Strain m" /LENGTH=263 /DNA_ID=CAMNT_0001724281 /DNA_START=59 /DNA_END=850 /DNA_ORIENTATION=-
MAAPPMAGETTAGNQLIGQEREWAQALFSAVQREGIDPRSMYEIAEYAIVSKGNVAKGLERVKKMRQVEIDFASERISSEAASRFLVEKFGTMVRAMGKDKQGRQSVYMDYGEFDPAHFESEESFRFLFKGLLEWISALAPTLADVRNGSVWICNCKTLGWKNFSLEMEKKFSVVYQDGMPLKIKAMYMVDSGTIITQIIKLCKVFLKKKLRKRIVPITSAEIFQFFDRDQLPPAIGGTFVQGFDQWMHTRLEQRQRSIQEVV